MFRRLTRSQRSNLYEMIWKLRDRDGVQLGFCGVDRMERPVIWVLDSRREPFMLPLRHDGADLQEPAHVVGEVRWLTDEEIQHLPDWHCRMLMCLGIKKPIHKEDRSES